MNALELVHEMQATMPGEFSSDLQEHLVQRGRAHDSETEYEFSRTEGGLYNVLVTRGDVKVRFEFEVKFWLGKAYVLPS